MLHSAGLKCFDGVRGGIFQIPAMTYANHSKIFKWLTPAARQNATESAFHITPFPPKECLPNAVMS